MIHVHEPNESARIVKVTTSSPRIYHDPADGQIKCTKCLLHPMHCKCHKEPWDWEKYHDLIPADRPILP